MLNDLIERLNKIQTEAATNTQTNIENLNKLRQTAKTYFDEKINQLIVEYELDKKIKIPRYNIRLWKYHGRQIEIPVNWRYLLSMPFIYGMIFPAIIWHIGIEIYHQICFRAYGIPLVDYQEYFIYDRQLLSWLNPWEKINCIYCSYVNNLVRYSAEIGGRTERFWCPIKYYRRINHAHSQYDKFLGGKNSREMRQHWEELRNFSDLEKIPPKS
jgi:hypothetical protein